MFIIFIYIVSLIAWGFVLFDMVIATYNSIMYRTDTPRLLIPLAMASLSLVIESAYFLIANIVRYTYGENLYNSFLTENNLFAVKIFIAISGVLMMLKLRSERKEKKKKNKE